MWTRGTGVLTTLSAGTPSFPGRHTLLGTQSQLHTRTCQVCCGSRQSAVRGRAQGEEAPWLYASPVATPAQRL